MHWVNTVMIKHYERTLRMTGDNILSRTCKCVVESKSGDSTRVFSSIRTMTESGHEADFDEIVVGSDTHT